MSRRILTSHEKALEINLDQKIYGTIAEIGGGQEVARWFFTVGGAAGTVAKSMSAYDMTFSDAIYGPTQRYVSRERLLAMLDHEYDLLQERLSQKRGEETRFFVFADTVAIRGFQPRSECHGWLGVRFQHELSAKPSEVILHIRLRDRERVRQQEALGVVGVNLLYSICYLWAEPYRLLESLLDNLDSERLEIDLVLARGPAFVDCDHRLLNLHLIVLGLARVILFDPTGHPRHPGELLHRKSVLIERGEFAPVTRMHLDMLQLAREKFLQDPAIERFAKIELLEITTKNLLLPDGKVDSRDFLERVDLLCAIGHHVLISNYAEFYEISAYLARYAEGLVGIVLGIPLLEQIFSERYYSYVEGGILEAMGRLFKKNVKLYVYPTRKVSDGELRTVEQLALEGPLGHLYAYLKETGRIEALSPRIPPDVSFSPRQVGALIRSGDPSWESYVPVRAAQLIREKRFFGYSEAAPAAGDPVAPGERPAVVS
ncbi:TonB-dependent receptor [Methylacidimicrobium sp. B4]|uniref:TonB-dependent receptor n=1 Tax=Methylacidimicrobium sp. B4 TaxID=2796139 RepID=UPI001A8CEDF7|nr:TonB-dependent receptor [Methylacidimicrobium sp. B4]QSR84857.1 TonB-dependent receptor [Methylacidimicrobium sp. B4]